MSSSGAASTVEPVAGAGGNGDGMIHGGAETGGADAEAPAAGVGGQAYEGGAGGTGGDDGGLIPPDPTFNCEEGFEDGAPAWTIEGGQWEFGGVNVNEVAPLSGTKLAGTVLANYYDSDVDARLVSPEIEVPEAYKLPRFKYGYYYDFGEGDYGQVQIRTVGGEWEDVPSSRLEQRSKRWSQRLIDLSTYAGQTVQLGFRIVSNTNDDTLTSKGYGFYIDNFSCASGSHKFDQPQSFEDPDRGDWSVEGGEWAFGHGNVNERPPLTGDFMAGTVISGSYNSNVDARLISPELTVPAASELPRLRYSYFYDLGAGDYGQLELRVDRGDWEIVEGGRFDQRSNSWSQRTLDLRPYAGKLVQVAFRLVTNANDGTASSTGYGFYVDDVELTTGAAVFGEPGFDGLHKGDWSVEGGQWAFGHGNVNEPPPISGEQMAGTVISQVYGSDVDSRLISPLMQVPSASDSPRFRFAYYYDFGEGDYGLVELRVDGEGWQTIEGGELDQRSKSWSQRVVDLRDYAGKSVQLAFRIVADTATGTAAGGGYGFYVDDAELLTGPSAGGFPQGFEAGGLHEWSVEGGQWAFGTGNVNEPVPHTGSALAGTVLGQRYGSNVDARLVSPPLIVPSGGAPAVTYYDWWDFGSGDYAQAQVRIEGGAWEDVGAPRTTSNKTWTARSIDLGAYAGQVVQVGFRVMTDQSTSTASTSGYGYYVDDVSLNF